MIPVNAEQGQRNPPNGRGERKDWSWWFGNAAALYLMAPWHR
ncbi:hypothetical protein OK016_08810 [Vibrio chagasii]|nr:hypothetical protein [Vibrio chagasii]